MRREADQALVADDRAGLLDRQVVLPEVDAVGPRCECKLGIVVQEEEHVRLVAESACGVRRSFELSAAGLFVAELEDVDAAVERGRKRTLGRCDVAHEIEPCCGQAFAALKVHDGEVSSINHVVRRDVIVVGGGVIGLAVAWRAAQRGLDVELFERDVLGAGASHAAAGMLAPIAEAEHGDAGRRLLELGLESVRRWPEFAAELAEVACTESALRLTGTLVVARDGDEAAALEREIAFRAELGLDVERLRGSEARELEGALAPGLRMGALMPSEGSVDPAWLIDSLATAGRAAGAELREHEPVAALRRERERVVGVDTVAGETFTAAQVVLAAGAWSSQLHDLAVRPVKGQIAHLRDPSGPGLLERSLRFEHGYLVPRADGRYALGATVEERGFDTTVTAGALHDLLRDAADVVPGVLELTIEELQVGFRPGTPDNLPLIGAVAPGLVVATGHYRNGILLTPITAEQVVDMLIRTPQEVVA